MSDRLWAEVAELIVRDYLGPDTASDRLPKVSELAAQYGVSRWTLLEAVKHLRDQGKLMFGRGRAMRRPTPNRGGHTPSVKPTASQHLANLFRAHIRDAEFRTGSTLPKIGYAVAKYGVSPRTVSGAYGILEREGLIVRTAKRWVVGSHIPPRTTVGQPAAIGLLVPSRSKWQALCDSDRTTAFGRAFAAEAQRWHVRVHVLDSPSPGTPLVELGSLEKLRELVTAFGTRYRGTLLPVSRQETGSLEHLVRELQSFGRPVVWFDRYNELPLPPELSSHCTRCVFSEESAVRAAVENLSSVGHRHVGYVPSYGLAWEEIRLAKLRDAASQIAPRMRIHSRPRVPETRDHAATTREWCRALEELRPRWPTIGRRAVDFLDGERAGILERFGPLVPLELSDSPLVAAAAARMAAVTPDVTGLTQTETTHLRVLQGMVGLGVTLEHPEITALVVPNDQAGRMYALPNLAALGIEVPRRMSVLSFDNESVAEFHGLSTVDFGFGYLGYEAFHAIMDDIPVARNRNGDIVAKAEVVDCGTVGEPRRGPLFG